MSALLEAILTILSEVLSTTGVTNTIVTTVIKALEQVIPLVASEATVLVPVIKNIVATLKTSGALTADQLATLSTLDAQADSALDAAAAADGLT